MNSQVPIEVQMEIENLVHEYRQYKVSVDSLMEDLQEVKGKLKPLLEEYGDHRDGSGYAKIVRGDGYSYVRVK